ncbi:MAG: MATE family efflux transporter [Nitrospirae bacterium]|nr:MATE family efflux transporter [Nitrospirota bacterium]
MAETRKQHESIISGSLWKNIWQLSWPMLIIMVLNFIVGFTDIYVAGLINPQVQAAVGFISQLYFLVVIVANAVSVGTLALVARAIGADDLRRALHIARQSLLFSLVCAVSLAAAGLLMYRQIIALAGVPPEIREITGDFFRIFVIALAPNYVLIISNAVFNASGEVKKPLMTMSLVTVVNVITVFGLVFGLGPFPALGYRGIATATAISLMIGMLMNLLFLGFSRWRKLFAEPWRISGETVGKILRIGWPAAMLQITWNAGSIVLYNILGRLGDTSITALASISNGLRIEGIIYLPAFALNMAASVLIGQNLGAGSPERAEKAGWKIALSGAFFMSAMAVVFFLNARYFASLLARNQDVLEETTRYLQFNMLSEPFMAMSAILGGALQGAGDTRGTLKVIGISMWLIRLPLAWFFALVMNYGATGVWMAMVISMCIQGILMSARFHKGTWKHLKVE